MESRPINFYSEVNSRMKLPLWDISDYQLADDFYLLSCGVTRLSLYRKAVIERLCYLHTQLQLIKVNKSDVEKLRKLPLNCFAEWVTNKDSDPFHGLYDDPKKLQHLGMGIKPFDEIITIIKEVKFEDLNFLHVRLTAREHVRFYSRQLFLLLYPEASK